MPEKADPVSALRELRDAARAFRGNKPYREADPTEQPLLDALLNAIAALSGEAPDRDGEPDGEAEEREKAWRAWNEVPEGAALIPPGEPCPICGPKGHGLHEDDSYGACVTCRMYVAHTDDVSYSVPFPCPAALYDAGFRAPSLEGAPDRDGEIAATTRALWDCGVLAGMDTDGDEGPGAIIAGMGIEGFARAMVGAVGELRDSYDECLDEPAAPALEGARHPEAGETPNAAALYSVLDWANRITSANRPPTPPKPGPDKEHG